MGTRPAPEERTHAEDAIYEGAVDAAIDADIAPLITFVEAETGWKFIQPLPELQWVMPGSPSDLEDGEGGDDGFWPTPSAEEPPVLRALGLVTAQPSTEGIPGEVAPGDAPPDAANGGQYQPLFDEAIWITHDVVAPDSAEFDQTMVHELTHAIQDDRDVGFIIDDAPDGMVFRGPGTGDAAWVDSAITEGQAGLVEGAWYWAQRPGEEVTFDLDYRDLDKATPDAGWGPLGVEAHVVGTWFVSMFAWLPIGLTPSEVVEGLPETSDALLNPETYLSGDPVEAPPEPIIPEGWHYVDDDAELSARRAWAMLAPVLDVDEARRIMQGWGGSTAWVVKDPDGVECVRSTITGDTPADTEALYRAFGEWIDRTHHPRAGVFRVGDHFEFNACDPGGDGLDVERRLDNLYALDRELFHTVHVLRWLTDQPATPERWACLIDVADDVIPSDVVAGWEPLDRAEAEPLARQIAASCDDAGH